MSDDIKPAVLSEGGFPIRRNNESREALSDHEGSDVEADVEHPSRTATAPSVEADANDDPQAPNEAEQG